VETDCEPQEHELATEIRGAHEHSRLRSSGADECCTFELAAEVRDDEPPSRLVPYNLTDLRMSTTKYISVTQLELDLANFRTVQQESEDDAISAMASTSPDRFWALMDSLLQDGYLPTESILVLMGSGNKLRMIVKEGNRRVAAIKMIMGIATPPSVTIPAHLANRIAALDDDWRKVNSEVPCVVYATTESETVDRIVTLAHGKGEKAARDQWNAVARARHNRDAKSGSEPALDLLEEWLTQGRNHTGLQAARWAGDYAISVLEEAMKRLAPRLHLKNARAFADAYPNIPHRDSVDEILKEIGLGQIGFEAIRNAGANFGVDHGIPVTANGKSTGDSEDTERQTTTKKEATPGKRKPKAIRIDDPRAVKRLLRSFQPQGSGREKVVQLRDEARQLDINKTPLAFCFLLRSMFEISAKAYCADHAAAGGPSTQKPNGREKNLVELLRDVVNHLTNGKKDKGKLKELHGALTELAKQDGLLSVTSMNQLVHNQNFVVTGTEVCVLFGRILPLLDAMSS
jgi:hypothetical protein